MKHKLQNLLKHKLQWLMLLAALLGVSQGVWGAYPSTIYVSNTDDKDTRIYLWKNSTSTGCTTWEARPTMTNLGNKGGKYYYSYDVTNCDYDRMKITNGGESGNITVPDNGNNCYDWPSGTWSVYCPYKDILDGTTICFYIGNKWGGTTMYLKNDSKANLFVSSADKTYNSSYKYGVAQYAVGKYNLSQDNGWIGVKMSEDAVAGYAYMLGNGDMMCGSSAEGNRICTISTKPTLSNKFDNSSSGSTSKEITAGTTSVTLCAKASQTADALNNSFHVEYYLKNGSCYDYITKTSINSTSDITSTYTTSSLSVGTYYIYPLFVSETGLAIKGDVLTLTVTPACSAPSAPTVDAPTSVCSGTKPVFQISNAVTTASYQLFFSNNTEASSAVRPESDGPISLEATSAISSTTTYYVKATATCDASKSVRVPASGTYSVAATKAHLELNGSAPTFDTKVVGSSAATVNVTVNKVCSPAGLSTNNIRLWDGSSTYEETSYNGFTLSNKNIGDNTITFKLSFNYSVTGTKTAKVRIDYTDSGYSDGGVFTFDVSATTITEAENWSVISSSLPGASSGLAFNSSGERSFTISSAGRYEFKIKNNGTSTQYGNEQKFGPNQNVTVSGSGNNCKLYALAGSYTFHFMGKDDSGNPIIKVTYSEITSSVPSHLYIKGPLHDNGSDDNNWPDFSNEEFSYDAGTKTFTHEFIPKKSSCKYGPTEFVLATSKSDEKLLNLHYVVGALATPSGWEYSDRDSEIFNFRCTHDVANFGDKQKLKITVTYDEYNIPSMKVESLCTAPAAGDFSYTSSNTYNASAQSANVQWASTSGGTITTYYKVKGAADDTYTTTSPTNAGTYTVAVTATAGNGFCAVEDKLVLGDYAINKSPQSTYSISSPVNSSSICYGNTPVTVTTTGGSDTGESQTFEIVAEGTTGSGTINTSTGVLTVTANGTFKVRATKPGGANYTTSTADVIFTVKGAHVSMSPTTVHPYEPVTFTEANSRSCTWTITRPEGVSAEEAYISATSGTSTVLKAKAATGYTLRAVLDGCNTDTEFNVIAEETTCPAGASTPSLRIGEKTSISGDYVVINLQVSDWGCSDITNVKVYYTQDDSEPSTSSSYWDFDLSESPVSSNTNFTLPPQQIGAGKYKIKAMASNTSGSGALSDEAEFVKSCATLRPGTINYAVVCSGGSADISLVNTAGTLPVVSKWQKSTTSDFSASVSDVAGSAGQTSINTGNLTQNTYYRVLVTDACDNEAYSKIGMVAIATIKVTPSAVSTTPYTPVVIDATSTAQVKWSVTSGNAYLLNTDHTIYVANSAAESIIVKPTQSSGSIVVTATAIVNGCSVTATTTLTMSSDSESCTN